MMLRELAEATIASTMSSQIKLVQSALAKRGVKNTGAPGVASKELVAAVRSALTSPKAATPGKVAALSVPPIIEHLATNPSSLINPEDNDANSKWLELAYSLSWYGNLISRQALAAADQDAKSVLATKSARYTNAADAIITTIRNRMTDKTLFTSLDEKAGKLVDAADSPMRKEYLDQVKSNIEPEATIAARLNRKSSVA